MVIRSTAYVTGQQAPRVPAAVSLPPIDNLLPPIRDLDLGSMDHHVNSHPFNNSRPSLLDSARFGSQQPLTPTATAIRPASYNEAQEACPRCGALQWSTTPECSSCGAIKFTLPFQQAPRNLDSPFSSGAYDDSVRYNTPMSRRDSGVSRTSIASRSDNTSNPPSRRPSTTAAPAAPTRPSARKRTAKVTRSKKSAETRAEAASDAQRLSKAVRERGSRRALKVETKRLEIRQTARGWAAAVDLNQNNQNKSGLKGKKLETLRRTNDEGRETDLKLLELDDVIRALVAVARKPADARSSADYAFLRDQEFLAAERSDVLRDIMRREDEEVDDFMVKLQAEEAEEAAAPPPPAGAASTRYPSPQSPEDSTYGSPRPYAL